jgi:hypothetical protein
MEIGTRVIAVRDADDDEVRVFGLGTYAGNHERPGWDPDAPIGAGGPSLREIASSVTGDGPGEPIGDRGEVVAQVLARMSLNPRIDLDGGGCVWGFQCWWGEGGQAELDRWAAGRRIVLVPAPDSKNA